jgi:IgGFc binding protein/CHU_C Type IX secretion signal domain
MAYVKWFFLLILWSLALDSFGQLDTIHWIPPMHARAEWGPQYLYLTTPEEDLFPVSIRDGAGNLLSTLNISNTQSERYDIGSSQNSALLVMAMDLHKPIANKGLIVDGPKKFYANFRTHSTSEYQAGDLSCKGQAALGTIFRIGHLEQAPENNGRRSNFIGMLATEDETHISLSDYNPEVDFRVNNSDNTYPAPLLFTLNKGESLVFSQYMTANGINQPPNGLMGALLESDKPIAVNTGSWCGSPSPSMANDIGIDQIVPFDKVGKEYIVNRGNGSEALEHPIVIAHLDNTNVWINGAASPVITLEAGGSYIVPTNSFSSSGNMYIRTSEPAFVYQMIGGASTQDDEYRTAGLIFVPPISCSTPNKVDNIALPNQIGDMRFEGGLMVTAMKDSLVTVLMDGVSVSLGAPNVVLGNPDFVTYRKLNLFTQNTNVSKISVIAQGAVQVAMFGRNQPASFAAFYSGFSKTSEAYLTTTLVGDGVCPDTIFASGRFDGVQWVYEDSLLQYGPDTMFIAFAPGAYIARGYLGVCRRTDFAADTVTAVFMSPEFPFTFEEPSCYDFSDGSISFGLPFGGISPYSFSIDNGFSFSQNQEFPVVKAGDYKLVARDSTGCYNRPLGITIGQPDSFIVSIVPKKLPVPLKPGNEVILTGVPGRLPILSTEWTPEDSVNCVVCLDFRFNPIESSWVTFTAYDSLGCPASDRYFVEVEPNVFAPNAIDLKSSFGNDRFTLFSRDPVAIKRLDIYDRWGEKIFSKTDIMTNQTSDGWDGYYKDKPVLPGVFVYVAEIELLPGRFVQIKGDITVFR